MKDAPPSRAPIRFGVFELDPESRELRKQGLKVRLQEQPFQILRVLLEHPGKVVTREELQQRIWPSDTFVDFDRGLYNAIKKLREALGDSAESPRFIETLSRRGYRFIAAVNGNGSSGLSATEVPSKAATTGTRASRRNRRIVVGLAVAALVAAVIGLTPANFWQRLSGKGVTPQIRSIAVLPLQNLSADPAQEYFSDGMTDALITDLAQIGSVKVISRTSIMRYKRTDRSLPEIAHELNVDGIVEGTVQRSDDRVRITAQLIHGPTDRHLWANSYERDIRNVFALERDVTEDIARQVQARLTTGSQMMPSQPQPTNLNALEAYLQGNYYLSKQGNGFDNDETLKKAQEYFQQAINADRTFAPAYAGMANTGTWVSEHETDGVTQVIVRVDGARTIVHAWGACHPTDCDWGETDADLWNGIPAAIWKFGFATTRMQLILLPDGRMVVASEAEYSDGSGRNDPGQAAFFKRQEIKSDSHETVRARALLRQTAETYRNLPVAYFEAVSTATLTTAKTEVRTVTQKKILSVPPGKIRVEFEGARESSLLIADGVSEWIVYPKANEYETYPQPQGSIRRSPLSRYVQLDNIRGDQSIVGLEDVQGAGCTVVRIALDHGATQQLWIDSRTHLVRKDIIGEGKSKEETVFTVARLGEPAPPDAFTYDPAATNAKNRSELAKAAPETLIGKAAPDFSLRDLDGRTVALRALRGQPVLLDFWATWCGECRQALPSVELLHRGLKDKLAVFGIDNEEPELAREYLQKYGYTLRTLVDRKDQAVSLYHVDGWPTTVLIDRDGKIAFYGEGFEPEKLRDALQGVGVW